MGLEVATYVNDLVTSNPIGASDPKSAGDDHLRLIKTVLKNTFPGMVAPLTIQSTDAGAAQGPSWIMDRFSASPAVDDLIGGLILRGRNSAAAAFDYVNIVGRIKDPVAGSEDSELALQIRVAGVLTEILTIAGAGIAGVGTGLTALNASNLASGTVADARLPATMNGKTLTNAIIGSGASVNGANPNLNIGLAADLSTGNASIEIGAGRTGSGAAFIDLHAQTGTDFETRVIRNSGANGTLDITQNGTGAVNVTASGGMAVTGNITSSAGSVIAASRVFAAATAGTTVIRPNGIGSATGQMTVDVSGNVVAAGNLTASSDEALKRDIETLETSKAIDAILHINPVKYVKKVGGELGIGFIAQDVEQYYPELVKHGDDGMRSLAYPNMNAILWSAVKYLLQKELAA